MAIDYYLAGRPLDDDIHSGDAGMVREYDGKLFLAVIDALGHGRDAHEVATTCLDFLEARYRQDLVPLMEDLHDHIRGSRGIVASLCLLDLRDSVLHHVSVGDTLVRKLNNDKARIYSIPGVIGVRMRSPRLGAMPLSEDDVLLLHTDGVPSHLDGFDDAILEGDARSIALEIIARYAKTSDDALCIVLTM